MACRWCKQTHVPSLSRLRHGSITKDDELRVEQDEQRLDATNRPFSALGRLFASGSTTLNCGRSWKLFLKGGPKHAFPDALSQHANLMGLPPAAVLTARQYSDVRNC